MSILRDTRRLYSIADVMARAGVDIHKRPIVCPLPSHDHTNYTASFNIFNGEDNVERFQCHGNCGAHGDVIDLAGYLWVKGYDPKDRLRVQQAVDILESGSLIKLPTSKKTRAKTRLSPDIWRSYLPITPDVRHFANRRGLNDETIERFKLGADRGYLTIPTFEDGILMAIKKRNAGAEGLRFLMEGGSKLSLFNHDDVLYAQGPVYYVKAEIPAMLLEQNGMRACAPTTGEGAFSDRWVQVLGFADVIVVGDNDEAGRKYAQRHATLLRAKVCFPPPAWKDVDGWILAKGVEALEEVQSWGK